MYENHRKIDMANRPKGITLIIIYYTILAISSGFVTFSTEQAGHLVEERYGDQLKFFYFFDYSKDLSILIGGVYVMVFGGLIILLLNRSPKARIGVICFELFSVGLIVVSLIFPLGFFPEEHPYYTLSQSKIDDVFYLIIPTLIIFYMFRSKTIQYFKKSKESSSENIVNDETK